jgi:Membrane bound beta barrel domain (DUF5777)
MMIMKKICILVMAILATNGFLVAQDDLMGMLDKEQKATTTYATATFKSTRVVTAHSIETVATKHLDFIISHRFGTINSGIYNLFGLDQSQIRFGLEYGLTDRVTLGIGRSNYQKSYDYFLKAKLLKQQINTKKIPVSVTAFGSIITNTLESTPNALFYNNSERQTYCGQLLIARKFGERASLQVSPTVLYRSKTEVALDPNTLLSIGLGGRYKITKRTSINAEYFYTPTTRDPQFTNALAIGFDIETGGHVFQLHFTNSRGMNEKALIGQTTGKWSNGDIFYGFNISRIFSFDRNTKKQPNKI